MDTEQKTPRSDSQVDAIVSAESPLRLGIENDELVIRVGINFLDGHEYHPDLPALKFDDRYEWARDVIAELIREKEDGSTPLTDLLDSAMIAALENGSIGVSEDSPTHVGTCENCGGEFMALRHTDKGQVCPECAER